MHTEPEEGWTVVVPAMDPHSADLLWREWSLSNGAQLAANDVNVETIKGAKEDSRRYLVRGISCVSVFDLAEAISADCEVGAVIVQEHSAEWYPELLEHPLLADLRRHVESLDSVSDCACIDHIDAALLRGDASVQNAVAVSFVEDSAWWEGTSEVFESWPAALRAELSRQQNWRPL